MNIPNIKGLNPYDCIESYHTKPEVIERISEYFKPYLKTDTLYEQYGGDPQSYEKTQDMNPERPFDQQKVEQYDNYPITQTDHL